MSGNISVNLEEWTEVTNNATSDVNSIGRVTPLDLLTNNITDIFKVQELVNDINDVTDRYRVLAIRDIAKMKQAGARAYETDSNLATALFAESIT